MSLNYTLRAPASPSHPPRTTATGNAKTAAKAAASVRRQGPARLRRRLRTAAACIAQIEELGYRVSDDFR